MKYFLLLALAAAGLTTAAEARDRCSSYGYSYGYGYAPSVPRIEVYRPYCERTYVAPVYPRYTPRCESEVNVYRYERRDRDDDCHRSSSRRHHGLHGFLERIFR